MPAKRKGDAYSFCRLHFVASQTTLAEIYLASGTSRIAWFTLCSMDPITSSYITTVSSSDLGTGRKNQRTSLPTLSGRVEH